MLVQRHVVQGGRQALLSCKKRSQSSILHGSCNSSKASKCRVTDTPNSHINLISYRSLSSGTSYIMKPRILHDCLGLWKYGLGSNGYVPRQFFRTGSVYQSEDKHNDKGGDTSRVLQEADAHAEEQEREHVFSESHFRDTVERLDVQNHMSLHQVSSSSTQAIDGSHSQNTPTSMEGLSNYEGYQYSSSGSVSLSSVMQSNVPQPYQTSARGSPHHMNMPGGGDGQADKYLAGHLNDVHPSRKFSTIAVSREPPYEIINDDYQPFADCQGPQDTMNMNNLVKLENPCPQGVQGEDCDRFRLWLQNCVRYGGHNCEKDLVAFRNGRKTLNDIFLEQEKLIHSVLIRQKRSYSTSAGDRNPSDEPTPPQNVSVKLSQKDRLKRAVKDYGATVVVFHVTISLMSLGTAYLAVSSGLDVVALLHKMGVGESILSSRIATGASTFVVAYAVHKVFAPVRIATTLTATPFIVRYLRRIGFLKAPKSATKV